MTQPPKEIPLSGGNVNTVVRVGATVRRPLGPHSQTVHAFLAHITASDLHTPNVLGIDDQGREVLSFIDGRSVTPADLYDDDRLLGVTAKLLRRLHDASTGFQAGRGGHWACSYPDPSRHEVICHNDFAPYNMILSATDEVSIIDFDLCGPGPRSRDLAYLAYWMTPLSFAAPDLTAHSKADLAMNCRRLKTLCAAYGDMQPAQLLPMVSEVLHHMADPVATAKMIGKEAAARLDADGHFRHWAAEATAFDDMIPSLSERLV